MRLDTARCGCGEIVTLPNLKARSYTARCEACCRRLASAEETARQHEEMPVMRGKRARAAIEQKLIIREELLEEARRAPWTLPSQLIGEWYTSSPEEELFPVASASNRYPVEEVDAAWEREQERKSRAIDKREMEVDVRKAKRGDAPLVWKRVASALPMSDGNRAMLTFGDGTHVIEDAIHLSELVSHARLGKAEAADCYALVRPGVGVVRLANVPRREGRVEQAESMANQGLNRYKARHW